MNANPAPSRPTEHPPLARSFRCAAAITLAALASLPSTASPAPGTELWQFQTGGAIYSSPAIAPDGTIYFGSEDHKLYALTPDGKEKWTFQAAERIDATPAVGPDGTVYVGSYDDTLYAVSPSGEQRWQFVTGGPISEAAAVASDGSVYAVSQDGNLYAFGANGSKKWQFKVGGSPPAPSLGRDGTLYIGSMDGNLYALNPDGGVKWKFRIRDPANIMASSLGKSCVLDENGIVYFMEEAGIDSGPGGNLFSSQGGMCYALRPDGTMVFNLGLAANSEIWFSPAYFAVVGQGNTLYGPEWDAHGVLALSPNGSQKWDNPLPPSGTASLSSAPAVAADGIIYVGAKDSTSNGGPELLALDSQGVKWKFGTGDTVNSSPTIGTNGIVYFGCNDNNLYAVAGSVGPGTAPWPMYRGNAEHTGALPPPTLTATDLGIRMYPGLLINGAVGNAYRIESQDRLTGAWSPVGTVTLDRTPYLYFDLGASNSSARFYRAILVSP